MTKSEIESSLRKAGAYELTAPASSNNMSSQTSFLETHVNTLASANRNQVMVSRKSPSIWWRVFKWIRNIIIAGCLAYTAYKKLVEVGLLNI
jgi:hypothetical protein